MFVDKMIRAIKRCFLAPFVFLLFFMAVPVTQLVPDSQLLFKMMPGDVGDARLNNYFLENVYLFLNGKTDSLWHLGFFWPFPYVLGFSDNLFGSSPVYIFFRVLTGQPDTAYQLWFLFGYFANFFSAYYALNKLGISRLSSCVGAVIFAFAIPVTAHAGHAQLHYRLGVPLSLLFMVQFLESRQLQSLIISIAWLVCGIYVGFFNFLLLIVTIVVFLFQQRTNLSIFLDEFVRKIKANFNEESKKSQFLILTVFGVLFGLLVLLFYPYVQVQHLYEARRNWLEISTMLPRPQSYLLADWSWFWSLQNAKLFSSIPMRHEHQMFPGLISMVLFIIAVLYGVRTHDRAGRTFTLMVSALALLVVMTLYIGGFSFWFLFHWLPLVSAIRAMTRVNLVMLLPLAIVVAYFLDRLREKGEWGTRLMLFLIMPALLIELSATSMPTSAKNEWRQRLESKLKLVPKDVPEDRVLFFAATEANRGWYTPELDAMWTALTLGRKTVNGYSGYLPPGVSYGAGMDCAVLPQRILSYLEFSQKKLVDKRTYQELISKIFPIGFENCDPAWWSAPPPRSEIDRTYTHEEFSKISFGNARIQEIGGSKVLKFDLINNGATTISSRSAVGRPIRISWRFLNQSCEPRTGWDTRKDIPFDIPAYDFLTMTIPLSPEDLRNNCGMEVSIVQELIFWGHEVGIKPLVVKFDPAAKVDVDTGQVYPLGKFVSFVQGGNGVKYTAMGWSHPEPWGTWSDGEAAWLIFKLAEEPQQDLVLQLTGHAFVTEKHPVQEIELKVNGHQVVLLRYDFPAHTETRTVAIPKVLVQDKRVQVEFGFKQPISPKAVGVNEDTRRLGLGLVALQLNEKSN